MYNGLGARMADITAYGTGLVVCVMAIRPCLL